MSSNSISPNNREILSARSTVTSKQEYLTSTNGALNTTATISTAGIATSDNQINGSQKTQIVDAGGDVVTVTGGKLDVNATASLAGSALPISGATTAVGVGIVDGSGNQITSFGGGTQYADGAVRGTSTGTLMMVDDGTNIQSASGNSSGEQIVQSKQNGTWNITNISGTISLPTGAATAALQTQPGVDIGDVTINNASGASAVNIQDGGNSITVDGTIAATQSGSWAVSGNKTNNNAAPTTDNIGVLPALVNASSPSFTEGNQTLLSINTTGNLRTTLNQIAGNAISTGNGVSGTGVQRITLASDSTGNIATIGTSVTPGTGATNLGKAEDSPHTTGDVGVMALAVRNDSGAVSAGADGDYIALTTDAQGALRVDLNGTVSTNNSTTSVLAGGAVFTGTSDDALNYNEITITVIASHASATDGLSIQQSSDNTNWDLTDTYTVAAATAKTFSVPRQARYFRVVYTNGATLQTSFRLQTILNRLGTKASSQRPSDAYSNEVDLEQEQSFLMGYNGTTWDRIRTVGTGVLSASAVLTAGSALVGKVGIDQTTPGTTNAVVDTPVTSGGLSIVTGSVGATATAIKASAGQLYGYHLFNTTAAVAYVQIFNVAAASVTLGTTAPTFSIGIPASGGVTVNFDKGIAFGTAISFGCTTTRAGSTGATCDCNFFFK